MKSVGICDAIQCQFICSLPSSSKIPNKLSQYYITFFLFLFGFVCFAVVVELQCCRVCLYLIVSVSVDYYILNYFKYCSNIYRKNGKEHYKAQCFIPNNNCIAGSLNGLGWKGPALVVGRDTFTRPGCQKPSP